MKKLLTLTFVTLLVAISSSGCSSKSSSSRVLRILNAADYIYEAEELSEEEKTYNYAQYLSDKDMLDQYVSYMKKNGVDVECVYDTYDTNETMYNELMTGKSSYDVIVASDYMVQKLITYNLVQPLKEEMSEFNDIRDHVSDYLWDIFDKIHPKDKVTNEALKDIVISQYSVPYMWGTVGVMYNPSYYDKYTVDEVIDIFSSWDSLYGDKVKNSFSIKDSLRDTYAVSIVHAFYEDEIVPLETKLENEEITEQEFNQQLNIIFNRCDAKTLEVVKKDMLKLKDTSFGFEVDSGKTDMVEGKIGANIAWSGDATWAIEEAESEYEKELYFSIPEEGSNIWFDAFCIPSVSQNADLAMSFIDFMSKPENAIQNMWSVGYTSSVSSPEVLDYIYECYDVRCEVGGESEDEYVEYDISYFFSDSCEEEDCILHAYPETIGRTLTAQFPEQSDLYHLCVMDDFGTQNEAVLDMWEHVRTNPLPVWAIIILIVQIVLAVGIILLFAFKKTRKNRYIKQRRRERIAQ